MNSPTKLIAGFLLLATAVAASALVIISSSWSEAPIPNKVTSTTDTETTNANTAPPQNVFIENTPSTSDNLTVQPGNFPTTTAPEDTLTGQLVRALGKKLDETNADGVQVTPDGKAQLKTPSVDQLVDALIAENGGDVRIPDWEKEANTQHITVLTKYTTADVEAYNRTISALMNDYLAPSSDISPDDPSNGLAMLPIGQARTRGLAIPVPEPLAGFHWSLMKLLAYQQKALDLAKLADTDPVQAALTMQAQEDNYFAALNLLQNEAKRQTEIRGLTDAFENNWLSDLYNRYLGIPTAHAQWLVAEVPANTYSIWEYVKMIVTEKLKDLLVHKLVMQTIQWIQGGGKPQFVTNWKGFLTGAAKTTAGQMISEIAPGLCTSFAPLIKVAVVPVDPSHSLDARPLCTIDKVVANVQNFARSFETGGWIAYGAAMQPSNNLIGSIVQSKMLVDQQAQQGAQATKNDTTASHGALSSQVCVKYAAAPPPTMTNSYCKSDSACAADEACVNMVCDDESPCSDDSDCHSGMTCQGVCGQKNGDCLEWKNTTPGEQLTNAMKDSGAAPLLQIVNAQDFAALLNALINAALSKLVKLGQNAISKGLLGLDMSKNETASSSCQGLTGNDLKNCQAEWQPVNCTPNGGNAPVNTGATVQIPGTPGTPATCGSCGDMGGTCCGNSSQCPGLNFYGIPLNDCPNGCYGPGTPNTCGTTGTPSSTATGSGTGTVHFGNSADCTGGTNLTQ